MLRPHKWKAICGWKKTHTIDRSNNSVSKYGVIVCCKVTYLIEFSLNIEHHVLYLSHIPYRWHQDEFFNRMKRPCRVTKRKSQVVVHSNMDPRIHDMLQYVKSLGLFASPE